MRPDRSLGVRFRFRWRHAAILVAYLAAMFLLVVPFLERNGQLGPRDVVRAALLASPPLLALLVVFLERTGPVKNWAVSTLLFLFYPALLLNHDYDVLVVTWKEGRPPTLWMTLLVNAMLAAYAWAYAGKVGPRRCPGCRRRTFLRLMRLFKSDSRSANTFWCASCGAMFWKDRAGVWRPERRTTWLGGPAKKGGEARQHPGAGHTHDPAEPGRDRPAPRAGSEADPVAVVPEKTAGA